MSRYKQIGKGSFTTAYRINSNTVLLKSTDPIKECMGLGWFPPSKLFPIVKPTNAPNEYVMKFYPKIKGGVKKCLNDKHWKIYQNLRAVFQSIPHHRNMYDGYSVLYDLFNNMITDKTVKTALLEALDAIANYGSDIGFEISPRNISYTETGRLILLDVFFLKSELMKGVR